jgi:hypothetical protein
VFINNPLGAEICPKGIEFYTQKQPFFMKKICCLYKIKIYNKKTYFAIEK